MAYPIEYAYSLTLKSNTANTLTGVSSATLYPNGAFPTAKPEGDANVFLDGFTTATKLKRREFKMILMPFVFPEHMADYDATETLLLSGKYMWLYSNGISYPYALDNVQVYVSSYQVEHNEDGTKRIEVTFTTSDYI